MKRYLLVLCFFAAFCQISIGGEEDSSSQEDGPNNALKQLEKNVSSLWTYIKGVRRKVEHDLHQLHKHQMEVTNKLNVMFGLELEEIEGEMLHMDQSEHQHPPNEDHGHKEGHHDDHHHNEHHSDHHHGEEHSHDHHDGHHDDHHDDGHHDDHHHGHHGEGHDEHHSEHHHGEDHHEEAHHGDDHHDDHHSHHSEEHHGKTDHDHGGHTHDATHTSHDHTHESSDRSHEHQSHDHNDENHKHDHDGSEDEHKSENHSDSDHHKHDGHDDDHSADHTSNDTTHTEESHHKQHHHQESHHGHHHHEEQSHHHHHHHDQHHSHHTSQKHSSNYDFAVCVVQPNSALPPEKQQNITGKISLWQKKNGTTLHLHIKIKGFKMDGHGDHGDHAEHQPGEDQPAVQHVHGIHVHQEGDLSNSCQSTGPHFNPTGVPHGGPSSPVRHVGDLGNIECDKHGVTNVVITDEIASLHGEYSIIGKAIVVHERRDDFGTNPDIPASVSSGDAGSRIACCVINKVDRLSIGHSHGHHHHHH